MNRRDASTIRIGGGPWRMDVELNLIRSRHLFCFENAILGVQIYVQFYVSASDIQSIVYWLITAEYNLVASPTS
jgi:hypothetical protein